MTDREKAIVMAYTGIAMLVGDKINEYYKYLAELYGRPVYTHELVNLDIASKAKSDFIKLCQDEQQEPHWIPCSERLPDQYGNYLISIDGEEPDIGTINPNDPRGWSLCDANGFYWASDKALNITAWMPLPEPYKENE